MSLALSDCRAFRSVVGEAFAISALTSMRSTRLLRLVPARQR